MGAVVAALATEEMESARVVMRRLLWNLNDESGGIGWGFTRKLWARSRPAAPRWRPNLRRSWPPMCAPTGIIWSTPSCSAACSGASGAWPHARPQLIPGVAESLAPFLTAADPFHRGLAAWAAGPLPQRPTRAALLALVDDPAVFVFYREPLLTEAAVGTAARAALEPARRQPLGTPIPAARLKQL